MNERKADADTYVRVFGQGDGEVVLQDLVARFYDVQVFVRGGPEGGRETDRRAAQREVVHFILRRIGQVNDPPPEEDGANSQPAR